MILLQGKTKSSSKDIVQHYNTVSGPVIPKISSVDTLCERQATRLIALFSKIEFCHITRQQNGVSCQETDTDRTLFSSAGEAHKLAKKALGSGTEEPHWEWHRKARFH